MGSITIPELDTPFVFREQPEAIPGDLRPLWRIGLVLLMLHLASRGKKSSFGRLHVLNWALRSERGQEALIGILNRKPFPGTVIVRIEPSLNRAVDFAHGERLVERATVQLDPTDAPDLHVDETLSIDGVTWAVSNIASREPILSVEVQRTLQRVVGGAQSRIDR